MATLERGLKRWWISTGLWGWLCRLKLLWQTWMIRSSCKIANHQTVGWTAAWLRLRPRRSNWRALREFRLSRPHGWMFFQMWLIRRFYPKTEPFSGPKRLSLVRFLQKDKTDWLGGLWDGGCESDPTAHVSEPGEWGLGPENLPWLLSCMVQYHWPPKVDGLIQVLYKKRPILWFGGYLTFDPYTLFWVNYNDLTPTEPWNDG